jgi:hypothetical protein
MISVGDEKSLGERLGIRCIKRRFDYGYLRVEVAAHSTVNLEDDGFQCISWRWNLVEDSRSTHAIKQMV